MMAESLFSQEKQYWILENSGIEFQEVLIVLHQLIVLNHFNFNMKVHVT